MTWNNAYAARVDQYGVVREVIVIPFMNDDDQKITEYCNSIGLQGVWIDTAFTGSRRGKFAGVGDLWNGKEFVTPGGIE